MKKFSVYAVLLSLGLFVVGCTPPKAADKPKTEAPATEAAKGDMPAEGDAKPAAEADAKPAAEGDAKPAAEPAPEKPAEEATK